MPRTERDSLGTLELPDHVYYGVQTARAIENFPVSGMRAHPELVRAYVLLKQAAAQANMDLGVLDPVPGKAIFDAAKRALDLDITVHFPVDVYQAGAGTSFNMNINEVIANIALEILGKKKGDYAALSPNDHVNMGQSSNDTFPTASHIAVLVLADRLLPVIESLADAMELKGKEFMAIPKSGRTHLMDAMPVRLGHEFKAYAKALNRGWIRVMERADDLLELPMGGTATGTGVNAHPAFRETVIGKISDKFEQEFRPAQDSFEALQSRALLAAFSSSLKELALELIRIANDLRLLGSGPTTGLAEIKLPPVQPGSSIMPGKVNPVMAECLNMIAFQVIGNDTTVGLAVQAGQLELNVMTPVITHNILQSVSLLLAYLPAFTARCVEGIEADAERCRAYLEINPSMATLLTPRIGYLEAASLAREALEKRVPVSDLAVEKGLISAEEAEQIFGPQNTSRGLYDDEESL
jgi:aspartate ammonia-lyase